jgi:hypothetical protein
MATAWNMFVKKIFNEGRSKNKAYSFKQALKDASRRKSEMGSSSSKTKKRGKMSMKGGDFEPNDSSSFSDAAPFKGGRRRRSGKNRSTKRRRR